MAVKRRNRHLTNREIFYALLVGTSLIMVWRGVWGLLDLHFFPNSQDASFVLSLIIGLFILLATGKVIKELT